MIARFINSPRRLVALTCAGSIITVAGYSMMSKSKDSLRALILDAAIILIGLVLVYWTPYQLREGVSNERWTTEQIEPLRNIVKHIAWTATTFVLVILMFVALLLDRHHHRNYFWIVFLLLQTMTQLTNAFRAPYLPPGSRTPVDWSKIQPLRSDHWGER